MFWYTFKDFGWMYLFCYALFAVHNLFCVRHGAAEHFAAALMNLLGLVCDPVGGLVECPCQNRNGAGAANALVCAETALSGIRQLIPFDEMLEAMYAVGRGLPLELRETALGGCAATPSGCRMGCCVQKA